MVLNNKVICWWFMQDNKVVTLAMLACIIKLKFTNRRQRPYDQSCSLYTCKMTIGHSKNTLTLVFCLIIFPRGLVCFWFVLCYIALVNPCFLVPIFWSKKILLEIMLLRCSCISGQSQIVLLIHRIHQVELKFDK